MAPIKIFRYFSMSVHSILGINRATRRRMSTNNLDREVPRMFKLKFSTFIMNWTGFEKRKCFCCYCRLLFPKKKRKKKLRHTTCFNSLATINFYRVNYSKTLCAAIVLFHSFNHWIPTKYPTINRLIICMIQFEKLLKY